MKKNSGSKKTKVDAHAESDFQARMMDLSTSELLRFANTLDEYAVFARELAKKRHQESMPFLEFKPRGGLTKH